MRCTIAGLPLLRCVVCRRRKATVRGSACERCVAHHTIHTLVHGKSRAFNTAGCLYHFNQFFRAVIETAARLGYQVKLVDKDGLTIIQLAR